jgi:hypothetical protein
MFIRTKDGLVHQTVTNETIEKYGKTQCDMPYTQDPKYATITDEIPFSTTAQPPVTCFHCIAKGDE